MYAHYIVEELRILDKLSKNPNQWSDLFPGGMDDFFLQNFQRVFDQLGEIIFKKLFGCAIVAPSPLLESTISYILERKTSSYDEQQAMDAVSLFAVLRTSYQTITFLHTLVPAWLTNRKKTSRKFFIDKETATKDLKDVFVEILDSFIRRPSLTGVHADVKLVDYIVRVAVRFFGFSWAGKIY